MTNIFQHVFYKYSYWQNWQIYSSMFCIHIITCYLLSTPHIASCLHHLWCLVLFCCQQKLLQTFDQTQNKPHPWYQPFRENHGSMLSIQIPKLFRQNYFVLTIGIAFKSSLILLCMRKYSPLNRRGAKKPVWTIQKLISSQINYMSSWLYEKLSELEIWESRKILMINHASEVDCL